MKKRSKRIIVIALYLVLVSIISYGITYFVDNKNRSEIKANIKVTFDDNDYYQIENSSVLDLEHALLEWPYIFTIENTSSFKGLYKIIINDDVNNDISRDVLHYILYLDDEIKKEGELNDLDNDILYIGEIDKKQEQKYRLYIYKNKENEGSIYKYSLELISIVDKGPGF